MNAVTERALVWRIAEFVKISHTVFALPFALASMLVAARGLPDLKILFWILFCMVTARTAAMAFNRVADWEIDKKNPRTAIRSKLIPHALAKFLVYTSIVFFVYGSAQLNWLCAALSPLAVGIILFYSITKRFTPYSHFFLGMALGVAPVGAWIAVRGHIDSFLPFLLCLAVVLWVFGFDLIYATQDVAFDQQSGLFSFPAHYGVSAALKLSLALHSTAITLMALWGWLAELKWPFAVAWLGVAIALWIEQKWARTGNILQINKAFFQINACVSFLILVGVIFAV